MQLSLMTRTLGLPLLLLSRPPPPRGHAQPPRACQAERPRDQTEWTAADAQIDAKALFDDAAAFELPIATAAPWRH